jgi:hypothetical protein
MCPFADGVTNGLAMPANPHTKPTLTMQHIAPSSLSSTYARVRYLKTFLSFTPADESYLHASKSIIAPLLPTILDAVYTKLLSFDITAAAFVPANTGYSGPTPTSVSELTLEHPQIAYRKDFLKGYLVKLVTSDFRDDAKIWEYFDNVGIMHTGKPGFKHRTKRPDLKVDYIHIGALLGYVVDLVICAVMAEESLDTETKTGVMQAFNKVVWIQNDLFARHYVANLDEKPKSSLMQGYGPLLAVILAVALSSFITAYSRSC